MPAPLDGLHEVLLRILPLQLAMGDVLRQQFCNVILRFAVSSLKMCLGSNEDLQALLVTANLVAAGWDDDGVAAPVENTPTPGTCKRRKDNI